MLCNSILFITSICGGAVTSQPLGVSIHNYEKRFAPTIVYPNYFSIIKHGNLSVKVVNFFAFVLGCLSFGLVGLIQASPVNKMQVIFYSAAPIVS